MQKMLLRLAFSTSSDPKEIRKNPSQLVPKTDDNDKNSEPKQVNIDNLPSPDEVALEVSEINIPLVWRKKRIVAVEEDLITNELQQTLEAKVVRLFIIPKDSEEKLILFNKLKLVLME